MDEALIAKIKEKKELKGIPSTYVHALLIKKFPYAPTSEKEEKIIIKTLRNDLRKVTGRYRTLKQDKHVSTEERKTFYSQLNMRIAELAPHRILDLGCGQNPLFQMDLAQMYYAYDLNEEDIHIVNEYCAKNKKKCIAKVCDIAQELTFPPVDLVLAYKVLDILDKKGHTNATRILRVLKTKYLLASFPTISLSGKRMHTTRRLWFEKALLTNDYAWETFASSNELFYLARRRSTDKVSSSS
jgi:hypothetical protein